MKRIKSFSKRLIIVIKCPIISWPLMVVIFIQCIPFMGLGGSDYDRSMLRIDYKNAPKETAYVDILVQMNREDPAYVDFTQPPQHFVREYTDENGAWQCEYVNLPITEESEIAKWNENGYVSLTLHHKAVEALRTGKNDSLNIDGYFLEDIYKRYGKVRVAYVDDEGNVLKVTDKSKKKYMGWQADHLVVNGDSVVFQIGEEAPWMAGLFCILALAIPLYTIYLIIKFLIFLYKDFFV